MRTIVRLAVLLSAVIGQSPSASWAQEPPPKASSHLSMRARKKPSLRLPPLTLTLAPQRAPPKRELPVARLLLVPTARELAEAKQPPPATKRERALALVPTQRGDCSGPGAAGLAQSLRDRTGALAEVTAVGQYLQRR
jgi:hypothetical protein